MSEIITTTSKGDFEMNNNKKRVEELKEDNFFIPRELFHSEQYRKLSLYSKLLYPALLNLSDTRGYVVATKKEIAESICENERFVDVYIKDLIDFNLVMELTPEEIKQLNLAFCRLNTEIDFCAAFLKGDIFNE